jgi:pheromone shutdown protein TraB
MSEQASAGEVRVLGTAHVSEASVAEVERVIDGEQPDVVAVELDEGRFRQLKGETPEDLEASDLLHGNTVFQFLAYWMLSYVQARLGEKFDIRPGAEMLAAVEAAEEHGVDVALVDRDVQVTVQRFWARLTAVEKLKVVAGLALGMADPVVVGYGVGGFVGVTLGVILEAFLGPLVLPTVVTAGLPGIAVGVLDFLVVAGIISAVLGTALAATFRVTAPDEEELAEFDPEELTDTDVVTAMMEEFRQFSPGGAEALIDERDAFIAHRLVGLRNAGKQVVAVVGAGHQAGIVRYLANPDTLPPMSEITGHQSSRFSVYKLFGYLFTLGFLVFFALIAIAAYTGVEGASSELLVRLFGAWFLVNALFASALAKLAGAHST